MNTANENAPDLLFFRESYLHDRLKFVENQVHNLYAVHNYENVLDFEYYFNIFQPDCVMLENAEYATTERYFDYEKIISKTFNSVLDKSELERSIPLGIVIILKRRKGY